MLTQVRELLRKPYVRLAFLACTFILCHLPLFQYFLMPDPDFFVCCDVNRYLLTYASKMKEGLIPYRDFESEYPPVALLLFFLPALATTELGVYQYLFAIGQFIFEIIGLLITNALLQRMQAKRDKTTFVVLGYVLLLASLGSILYSRYDMTVSTLVLAALYLFLIGKKKRAWVVLAVSVMTKPYTIVIAPLFLISQLPNAKKAVPVLLEGVLYFLSTLFVIALPFLLLSFDGFLHSFLFHAERGIQIETLYSSFLHIFHTLGSITEVHTEFRYGAFELISPISPFLSKLAFFLTAAGLLGVYLIFYKVNMGFPSEPESLETRSLHLYRASVMAILTFILFYKVFSSQFLIWVYPLVPLVCRQPELRAKVINGLLILSGGVTQLIYPLNYVLVNGFWMPIFVILTVRNGILLLCLVLLGVWSSIKTEKRVFQFSLLIITLLGIYLLELFPILYHMQGFPTKFNVLVFLLAMGAFLLWCRHNGVSSKANDNKRMRC